MTFTSGASRIAPLSRQYRRCADVLDNGFPELAWNESFLVSAAA